MLLPVEKRRRWGGAAEITRILNASHAKQCRGESGALECNSLPLKSLKFSFFQLFVCPPNVPKTQEDWILELQLRVYSWRPGYRSFCLSGCSGASWTAERGVHCPGSGHQTAVSLPRSTKPNNPLTTTSGGSTLNNSWAGEWPPPPPSHIPIWWDSFCVTCAYLTTLHQKCIHFINSYYSGVKLGRTGGRTR